MSNKIAVCHSKIKIGLLLNNLKVEQSEMVIKIESRIIF